MSTPFDSATVASAPAVSVAVGDSSHDIPFSGEIHHIGIMMKKTDTKYSGSVLELPGLKSVIVDFPKVALVSIDIMVNFSKAGQSLKAALTGQGASVSSATVAGYKQSFVMRANQFNLGDEHHKILKPGDGVAAQIKPVSATAVPADLHVFVDAQGEDIDVVLHIYFQLSGPMNKVVSFQ